MITHRRPLYTQRSLERLLETASDSVRVWVWQNGTDAETVEVVNRFAGHPRLHKLYFSPENVGLRAPTNWLWSNADGDYVGKVDDDCLVPPDWFVPLRDAHAANADLGIVGLWLYPDEDFIPELARRKIEQLEGGHQLLRHPWVQGSGYLMKRECLSAVGQLRDDESFTDYCIRVAQGGWTNGFYFPFLHEDHMDDPRSPNTLLRSNDDMVRFLPLSARNNQIHDLQQWEEHIRYGGFVLQYLSPEPRSLGGLRGRVQRRWTRLMYLKWRRRRARAERAK